MVNVSALFKFDYVFVYVPGCFGKSQAVLSDEPPIKKEATPAKLEHASPTHSNKLSSVASQGHVQWTFRPMRSKQLQSSPIPKSIKTVCREIPSQHVLLPWPRYPLPNQRPHKLIIHVTAIISSIKRQHGNTMKNTQKHTLSVHCCQCLHIARQKSSTRKSNKQRWKLLVARTVKSTYTA